MKYTDNEIIKALECCNTPKPCDECPYYDENEVEYDDLCMQKLVRDVLPLINRQKAEIESLNAIHADALESLRLAAEANKDMQAEVKRLEHTTSGIQSRIKNSKVVEFRRITSFEPFAATTEKEISNESQNT